MARKKSKANIKNPLSANDCTVLKDLAKYAKENELLEGADRKRLFQAGQFPNWFSSNFTTLPENLNDIIADLDGTEDFPTAIDLELIRDKIICAGDRYGIAPDGSETSKTELVLFEQRLEKEELSQEDRINLALLQEDFKKFEEALVVAKAVFKELPENSALKKLIPRLEEKLAKVEVVEEEVDEVEEAEND